MPEIPASPEPPGIPGPENASPFDTPELGVEVPPIDTARDIVIDYSGKPEGFNSWSGT
jgi:hypothetical protein